MKKLPQSTALRSSCPIATALDILGDKWTLLLIRDIGLFGRHRYKDFQESKENMPSNILATRLARMVKCGLLEKRPYQDNPPRYDYHLTSRSEELVPLVKSLAMWSAKHVSGVKIPAGRSS